jgi:hypothetical protein
MDVVSRRLKSANLAAALLVSVIFSSANAFENQHFIGGGGLYGVDSNTDAITLFASYEYQFKDFLGFEGRPTYFSYDYEKGNEKEEGDGIGINIFANYYPVGGLLLGIGTGLSAVDWEYVKDENGNITLSDDSKVTIAGLAKVGYKFEVENFYITPMFEFSHYFSTGEESGTFYSIGIDLGYAF